MNSVSDTVVNGADSKVETSAQEQQSQPNTELVELGKVSDTRGGWLGSKADSGMGFTTY